MSIYIEGSVRLARRANEERAEAVRGVHETAEEHNSGQVVSLLRYRMRDLTPAQPVSEETLNALFESEFFGHVRGSFTGALKDKPGRFELADGGTLFLDEIGEVPLAMPVDLVWLELIVHQGIGARI